MVYYELTDDHIRHVLQDTLRHVQEESPGVDKRGATA
jgi:DNA-binding transcriptional ArsR family regulator